MENKKYDRGKHIPLDNNNIPMEDTELALREFSRGSQALMICLRIMWMNGLRTYSCNPSSNTFEIGHIVMEEGEDIFSYLSKELLENDDRIKLNIIDNKQEIRFAGTIPEKEGIMLSIAREILSGRKNDNSEIIESKIGGDYPKEWVRRLKTYNSNPNSTYWGEKVYIKRK